MTRLQLALAATLLATPSLLKSAGAADSITIGKAIPISFAFAAVEVGQDAGIWQSENLDVHVMAFRGDAVLQQALTTGSIDFGLGSGPAMGFHVKGAPATGIAVIAGAPYNMALCIPTNSPIHTAQDLRGKTIGFSTVGSLTDWLLRETSRQQGWGSTGIHGVPLGAAQSSFAAIRAGQADGVVSELASCLELQQQGSFKTLIDFGDQVKQFYTHILFAPDTLIQTKPDLIRRTLQAWFKTIAYMRTHKPETVASIARTTGLSPDITAKTYDLEMHMMSDNGAFDQPTLEVIAQSLKELDILPNTPDTSELYDGRFVPVDIK